MGNAFLEVRMNEGGETTSTRSLYEIEGKVFRLVDAQGRIVSESIFEMSGLELNSKSMDFGPRWRIFTALGEPLMQWDDIGYRARFGCDILRRVTKRYILNSDERVSEYLDDKVVYREESQQPDPEFRNFRKKEYQVFDQAGTVTNLEFDFKGNLLREQRQFAKDYKSNLDWSDDTNIESEPDIYLNSTTYDALNRIVTTTTPDLSTLRTTFLPGSGLLGAIDVNLIGEQQGTNTVWTNFVTSDEYDAYSRRIVRLNGNRVQITDTYDPQTQNVTRSQVRSLATGVEVYQDNAYTYDPVGNTTYVADAAHPPTFLRSGPVDAHLEFTYDALYRLTESTGREYVGQTGGNPPGPPSSPNLGPDANTDDNALAKYTESYSYGTCDNLISVRHQIGDPHYPGWKRTCQYNDPSALRD